MFIKKALFLIVCGLFFLFPQTHLFATNIYNISFCWDDPTNPAGTYYEVMQAFSNAERETKITNDDWDDVAATKADDTDTKFCYCFSFDSDIYAGIFVAVRAVSADDSEKTSAVKSHYLYGNIVDVANDGTAWDEVYVGPDDWMQFSYEWSLHADQHDIVLSPYPCGDPRLADNELPTALNFCNLAPPWDNLDWYDYFQFSYHYSYFPSLPAN